MRHIIRVSLLLAATVLVLANVPASAGGKATFKTADATNGTITLIWRDSSNSRMRASGDPGYFIVRDGKAYSVFDAGGTPRVMAMAGMNKMIQGMGGQGADNRPTNQFASLGSVKPTGATETVAGIDGRVYQMHWTDADGNKQSGKAVLTDDPLAEEMTHAYLVSVTAMSGSSSQSSVQKQLPQADKGLLRVGNAFRVQSIERAEPPASTFELPAKPMDLQQMMGGMGAR